MSYKITINDVAEALNTEISIGSNSFAKSEKTKSLTYNPSKKQYTVFFKDTNAGIKKTWSKDGWIYQEIKKADLQVNTNRLIIIKCSLGGT